MVVDLAVEHDPAARIARRHRLQPALGEIEDRQPAVAERHSHASPAIPMTGVRHQRVAEPAGLEP